MQGDKPFPLRTESVEKPKVGVLDLPDNKFVTLVVGMLCLTSLVLCCGLMWMVSWFV